MFKTVVDNKRQEVRPGPHHVGLFATPAVVRTHFIILYFLNIVVTWNFVNKE